MGECINVGRGGKKKFLPILNANYPSDVSTTYIDGNTASATFKVEITTDGYPIEYTYQWYVNDSAVSGATGTSYSWTGTEGTYSVRCDVTNKAGTVQSRTATLSVVRYYKPVLNGNYPTNMSFMARRGSVRLEVQIATHGNPSDYTYKWYWGNGNDFWAESRPYFDFTNIQSEGTHYIYCEVTNAAGTVRSRTATITVRNSYLYNGGEVNTDITGGFMLGGAIPNSEYSLGYFSKSGGKLYLDLDAWTSCLHGFVTTVNPVDLTHYSKIRFTVCQIYTSYWSEPWRLGASGSRDYANDHAVAVTHAYGTQDSTDYSIKTYDVDVSGISGSYYVGFWLWFYYDATNLGVSAIQLIP